MIFTPVLCGRSQPCIITRPTSCQFQCTKSSFVSVYRSSTSEILYSIDGSMFAAQNKLMKETLQNF